MNVSPKRNAILLQILQRLKLIHCHVMSGIKISPHHFAYTYATRNKQTNTFLKKSRGTMSQAPIISCSIASNVLGFDRDTPCLVQSLKQKLKSRELRSGLRGGHLSCCVFLLQRHSALYIKIQHLRHAEHSVSYMTTVYVNVIEFMY
jgi:hypothetical protein